MPKGIYKHKYRKTTGYTRLYQNNHYKKKHLDFDVFMRLTVQNCYYCGAEPRLVNPNGSFEACHANNGASKAWYDAQWVIYNGIDKMEHAEDYKDVSNLVPCCKLCNFMKQRLGKEAFLAHVARIHAHQTKDAL